MPRIAWWSASSVGLKWDAEEGVWRFMRTCSDKNMPNAYHVYENVMQSIHDNIAQEDLHAEIKVALKQLAYATDVAEAARHAQAAGMIARHGT